jgi:hypothetical protein
MPAILHFDKDHRLQVDEDVDAVEGKLRRAPPSAFAVVTFGAGDDKLVVNAALVRAVTPVSGDPTG